MADFVARLRMEEGDGTTLRVVVSVGDGRLAIRTGATEVGAWPLATIDLAPVGSGFRLVADGESALLDLDDPAGFSACLPAPEVAAPVRGRVGQRQVAAVLRPQVLVPLVGIVGLVALGVVAPTVTGIVLLLLGSAALIAAMLTASDPIRATRLPGRARPWWIAVAGTVAVAAGALAIGLS